MAWTDFLRLPGRPGPWGALMDEAARAAEDFCVVAEGFPEDAFVRGRVSDDADTVSPRSISVHVCGAAGRYADYVHDALGTNHDGAPPDPDATLRAPGDVRGHLTAALRYTESTIEPLLDASYEAVRGLAFEVRWGPTYDPEMLLEHGICHLLRHRRQLERWD